MFPDPVLLMGLFQPLGQLSFAPDPDDTRNRSFGERKKEDFLGCLNLIMKNVSLEPLEEAGVRLQGNLGLLCPFDLELADLVQATPPTVNSSARGASVGRESPAPMS